MQFTTNAKVLSKLNLSQNKHTLSLSQQRQLSARPHANEMRPKMAATQLNQRQTLDVQPAKWKIVKAESENVKAKVEKDTCILPTTLLYPTYNSTTV